MINTTRQEENTIERARQAFDDVATVLESLDSQLTEAQERIAQLETQVADQEAELETLREMTLRQDDWKD